MNKENIFKKLELLGFIVTYEMDNSNWYLEKNDDIVNLVAPHEGNNNKWMLRADFKETFDKWGNALFEGFFEDINELDIILDELKSFLSDRAIIIRKELG